MIEIVYILTNEAIPGLIKLGRTSDLRGRLHSLSQGEGVPLPFEIFYACEVADATLVETRLYEAFGDYRISKKREFFRIAPERVKAVLSLLSTNEVQLGDEAFETPEDKADLEAVKRRARFQFSAIELPVGTELQLSRDPTIVCKVVDDKNQVEFEGEKTSLSEAATRAFQKLGYALMSLSGPREWTYQGKRLDDIRREIEEKVD